MAARSKSKGPFVKWPVLPEFETVTCPSVGMSITSCQVYLLSEPLGKTKAMARLILNDCLQLTDLRILDGANGLFVSYPTDPNSKSGSSIYYPLTREFRDCIQDTLVNRFVIQATKSVYVPLRNGVAQLMGNTKGEMVIGKKPVPLEDLPLILSQGFGAETSGSFATSYRYFYEQLAKQNGMA